MERTINLSFLKIGLEARSSSVLATNSWLCRPDFVREIKKMCSVVSSFKLLIMCSRSLNGPYCLLDVEPNSGADKSWPRSMVGGRRDISEGKIGTVLDR